MYEFVIRNNFVTLLVCFSLFSNFSYFWLVKWAVKDIKVLLCGFILKIRFCYLVFALIVGIQHIFNWSEMLGFSSHVTQLHDQGCPPTPADKTQLCKMLPFH